MTTFLPSPNVSEFERKGSHLFIAVPSHGGVVYLPPICVKCGQPATDKRLVKTFTWHHPALYLLALAALLIYVIVAMITRKSIRVSVPLCAQHWHRRYVWTMLAGVLPLVGIADAFVLSRFDLDPAWIALLTVVLILTGLIIWSVIDKPIRPRMIDATRAEFSGFGEPFLDHFPGAR